MEITYSQLLLRRLVILAMLVGFCLLPGPRGFLVDTSAYLLLPDSIASFQAGFHLSVIHFCWLFGFELPAWELPDHIDPWLTTLALMASGVGQVAILRLIVAVWNFAMHRYYERKAEMEELAEFGDFEV